jgi:hypothetical protein
MAFPGTYNFNYYRGDTFEFIINPKDASGAPFSLAGFTGAMTIASRRGFDDPLNDSDNIISFNANVVKNTTGGLTCTIPSVVGRLLTTGIAWQYDVEIVSDEETFTLLSGTITVFEDVTGANPQFDFEIEES